MDNRSELSFYETNADKEKYNKLVELLKKEGMLDWVFEIGLLHFKQESAGEITGKLMGE